ncbi:MAG TPA: oxidoreductase [Pedobacter sp.]
MEKKAILAGASGSVGSSLLLQLLACKQYSHVLVLVRKELRMQHPKLKQLVIDFDRLSDYSSEITGDVVFCCLGTTKSQTPDQQQYRKIDYQYPLDIAWIAQVNGAESYHLISSIGANKDSSAFYIRTKGELERDLKAVPFKNIHIYRPSLLDGARQQRRLLEESINAVMYFLNPLLVGGLKKYRSIKVETIAAAMIKQSLNDDRGIFIYESDQIARLGTEEKLPLHLNPA